MHKSHYSETNPLFEVILFHTLVDILAKSQHLMQKAKSIIRSGTQQGSDPRMLWDKETRVMNLEGEQGCTKKSLTNCQSLWGWTVNTTTNTTHPLTF